MLTQIDTNGRMTAPTSGTTLVSFVAPATDRFRLRVIVSSSCPGLIQVSGGSPFPGPGFVLDVGVGSADIDMGAYGLPVSSTITVTTLSSFTGDMQATLLSERD